ncbi:hypothetical protein [Sporosarcina sp. A2]|uniref:hypothetical protein n=1 Tax=Sporosarcina sp. A2 TaxID=3393449 RepID=UPI003D78D7B6
MEHEGRNVFFVTNDYRQITNTVNNPQGTAISFGPGSTNNVANNYGAKIEDLTKDLLQQLGLEDMDASHRVEISELIEAASQEANSEQPRKALIRNFLSGSKGLMDAIVRSPELIEAYGKWATFIQSVV